MADITQTILSMHFFYGNFFLIKISLKFVSKGPTDNIPTII